MMCSVAFAGAVDPDYIADTMTSEDGTYKLAFVTDVGNIDDQSFNQYTWQGVQDFCSANSLNANYYRPTEDSDAARL